MSRSFVALAGLSLAGLSLAFSGANAFAQDATRPSAVSVQSSVLQEVGPWGAAALPTGLLPLSSDLWRGADPATLGILFARITPDQRFPILQKLTRQAIFSGGLAPTPDRSIAQGRFEVANRLGPAEAAARLIFGVPRLASDPGLANIAIDAGLRVGRIEEACGLVESVAPAPTGTLWLESRAACYALNNEADAANLSVDLAKARGLTDTWLSRAIAAVAGPLTAPPPFRVDSGRAMALSFRSQLKPPLTLAATQDPMALSALIANKAFMESLSPDEQLSLIRNGASRGVVPSSALASFQPELDPAITPPSVSTQISDKMLSAPSLTLRAIVGQGAVSDIRTVVADQPGSIALQEVPLLIEAALWAGEGNLASSIAALAPGAIDPRLGLVLALYQPEIMAQSVQQRLEATLGNPTARRIALRDVVIAWAGGIPAGDGLSLLVQAGLPWGPAGNAGLRAAMDLASSRGSKGEVILLASLALQGVDPASSDAETVAAAINALRKVGLSGGARDLARDYLLANLVTLPAPSPAKPKRPAQAVKPPPARPISSPDETLINASGTQRVSPPSAASSLRSSLPTAAPKAPPTKTPPPKALDVEGPEAKALDAKGLDAKTKPTWVTP